MWPFPLNVVPKLRTCYAVLVLTSDLGREEHHGRTNQPQTSWVPLALWALILG